MGKHIIISESKKHMISSDDMSIQGSTYCVKKGFWIDNKTGTPMMLCENSNKPTTKKWDIETGEDQKGE